MPSLEDRCRLACDFLCQVLLPDNSFKTHLGTGVTPNYSMLNHIYATSVLFDCSTYFNEPKYHQAGLRAESYIRQFEFMTTGKYGQQIILLINNQSLTSHNAANTILSLKRNNADTELRLKSVLNVISTNTIQPFAQGKNHNTRTNECSLVVYCVQRCLDAFNDCHQDFISACDFLLKTPLRHIGIDAWTFALLGVTLPLFKKKHQKIVESVNTFDVSVMTSFFAAQVQQISLSDGTRNEKALHRQLELQILNDQQFDWKGDHIGAFILNPSSPQIRLDFTVHNIRAILQYLNFDKKSDKWDMIV